MWHTIAETLIGAAIFAAYMITGLLALAVGASVVWGPRRVWHVTCRILRTAQRLATDRRLPAWLRVFYASLLLITHVIPGPVDEAIMIVPLMIIVVWHRPVLISVWHGTARTAN